MSEPENEHEGRDNPIEETPREKWRREIQAMFEQGKLTVSNAWVMPFDDVIEAWLWHRQTGILILPTASYDPHYPDGSE